MPKARVLILDDDETFLFRLADALQGVFRVDTCTTESEFSEQFAVGRYDLLIMDMRLRESREGLVLLREALERDPAQAAIVMTAYSDTASYGEAIAAGALTYLDKQEFSPALIARTVEAIIQQGVLRRRLAALERRLETAEIQEMIGVSTAIKEVGEAVRQAAEDGYEPVLIVGEIGSGRKLAARSIHRLSRRRNHGPFVIAPCRHADASDCDTALFGKCYGLEGGRVQDFKGWMDEARGGVLYVDGVESLPAAILAKLARTITSGCFTRAGGSTPIDVDAQIVLSTRSSHADPLMPAELRDAIGGAAGKAIRVPPLRARTEDLPLIAQYVLQQLFRSGRSGARSIRGSALTLLESHDWPGNVRELCSAIEYAAARADATDDREVGPEHLPLAASTVGGSVGSELSIDYRRHLARAECDLVEQTCEQYGLSTQTVVAERLGYNDRFTFARRIRKHLGAYPELVIQFPQTATLFGEMRQRRVS